MSDLTKEEKEQQLKTVNKAFEVLDGGSRVKVVKVLTDPKRVVSLLTNDTFIQMINATRAEHGNLVKILCNTLEYNGYRMEEIVQAVELISKSKGDKV